jgi:hypothetical protein
MALRLSALRAGRPLPPRKIPSTHFSYRLSRPQAHGEAGMIRSIKVTDLIGTRTRDLPACSIVPQPTTLPRALSFTFTFKILSVIIRSIEIYVVSDEQKLTYHKLILHPDVLYPDWRA